MSRTHKNHSNSTPHVAKLTVMGLLTVMGCLFISGCPKTSSPSVPVVSSPPPIIAEAETFDYSPCDKKKSLKGSSMLTCKAWLPIRELEKMAADGKNDPERKAQLAKMSLRLAEMVIGEGRYQAAQKMNKDLEAGPQASRIPPLPSEKTTKPITLAEFNRVNVNGILNDVGTCFVIIGMNHLTLGEKEKAIEALKKGAELTQARCWDPRNVDDDGFGSGGSFWDTSQKCKDLLASLGVSYTGQ